MSTQKIIEKVIEIGNTTLKPYASDLSHFKSYPSDPKKDNYHYSATFKIPFKGATALFEFSLFYKSEKVQWMRFTCDITLDSNKTIYSNIIEITSLTGFGEYISLMHDIQKNTTLAETAITTNKFLEIMSCTIKFISEVNEFIKEYKKEILTPSYKFNKFWNNSGLNEKFISLDNEADDNFALEWLSKYPSALSNQIANANIYESINLLSSLQPDFISELVDATGECDDNTDSIPLLTFLYDYFGVVRTKEIIEKLYYKIPQTIKIPV